MSQNLDEQLSALLDGELPEAELELLLARLDRDPVRRQVLGRYSMIGECLRSGTADPAALALTERVRVALLADTKPEKFPGPQSAPAWRNWVAASMAAAAVFVAWFVTGPQSRPMSNTPVAHADIAVTALLDEPLAPVRSVASHRLNPSDAARLTGYLVAHGEYANQLSRSNFDSHLVSARVERASWQKARDMTDGR